MQGSVRKRGEKWYYSFEIPNGDKRKRIERVGGSTKKEAQILLTRALSEYDTSGKVVFNTKDTFDEIFNLFITLEANTTRKYSTVKRYMSLYNNHILEALGNKPIANITAEHIQRFIIDKKDTHSAEYVRSIYNLLYVVYGYAKRTHKLKENIMQNILPPSKVRETEVNPFKNDQLVILSERLKSTNLHMAFMLGLHLGVRAGECYALRWSDVNFEKSVIVINKQLQDYKGSWSFTTLKTENSYRSLSFGNVLKKYLTEQLEKRKLLIQVYGKMFKSNKILDVRNIDKQEVLIIDDFINIKPDGDMLNTNSHKVISRIASNELDFSFKFHNLRHTHATKLAEAGVHPKVIQKRLGHSKIDFTMKVYTHVTDDMDNKTISILDSSFEEIA